LKFASFFGIIAAIILIICCFIPWAYYPDLQQNFTGFYSQGNDYGKPGKAFIFLSVITICFFLIPTLWAKRANQFIAVILFAYALKTYLLFAACYGGTCPTVRAGLYGFVLFPLIILISSLLSKAPLKSES
jgi:hypothetical protein